MFTESRLLYIRSSMIVPIIILDMAFMSRHLSSISTVHRGDRRHLMRITHAHHLYICTCSIDVRLRGAYREWGRWYHFGHGRSKSLISSRLWDSWVTQADDTALHVFLTNPPDLLACFHARFAAVSLFPWEHSPFTRSANKRTAKLRFRALSAPSPVPSIDRDTNWCA